MPDATRSQHPTSSNEDRKWSLINLSHLREGFERPILSMHRDRNWGDTSLCGLRSVMTMRLRGPGVFPPVSHGESPHGNR
jgi:hypothetical protein